jgi:hypothetical protein
MIRECSQVTERRTARRLESKELENIWEEMNVTYGTIPAFAWVLEENCENLNYDIMCPGRDSNKAAT